MKQLLSAAIISVALLGGSRLSAIEEGSWVMSLGTVEEPPVIAILRQTSENEMTIAFTFWNGHSVLIPLRLSHSPDNPEVVVLSGSVPFIEEREQYDGPDVRLLAFHGYFPENGTGSGRIVVMSRDKNGRSETEFGMRSLKQLNSEAEEATKAEQGGAGRPATRSESDSEGGDKPQPEAERRFR